MTISIDSTIAVVGAGVMGSGIAQTAAQAGHAVTLIDANVAALERSRAGMAASFDKLVQRGKFTQADRNSILERISWSGELSSAADADLIVEAIIEDGDAKAGLFNKLEAVISPDAVLASNTSSLSITDLASTVERHDRFVGLHFFNPVPVMKLVEIVPGPHTSPEIVDGLIALMKSWRKVPVEVRDVPGFIVNRVARPYYAEGMMAWSEGIDPASIDNALKQTGGFRMGPLALTDLIGQDVNYAVAQSVYQAYNGKTRFRPQAAQAQLTESGNLGKKTGSGVYDHSAPLPEPTFVTPSSMPADVATAEDCTHVSSIVNLLVESGIAHTTDAALPPNSIRIGNVVLALGDGRPLAGRPDADALLDHARNFGAAGVWIVTARTDPIVGKVAAFAEALGKKVITVPDRAGQIVLRTLAQIANAAADAVTDQVASPADIDAAMLYGANHPEGPLAWADRIGHNRVALVLNNIAEATGDELYRPSAYFEVTS